MHKAFLMVGESSGQQQERGRLLEQLGEEEADRLL